MILQTSSLARFNGTNHFSSQISKELCCGKVYLPEFAVSRRTILANHRGQSRAPQSIENKTVITLSSPGFLAENVKRLQRLHFLSAHSSQAFHSAVMHSVVIPMSNDRLDQQAANKCARSAGVELIPETRGET